MFDSVQTLIRKGNEGRDRRDWGAAQKAYDKALRRKPRLAHIWVQYGHVLKEAGLVAEGLAAYRRSDDLLPDQADTHLQIGRALGMLGQPELALDHFERSITLAGSPCDAEGERRNLLRQRPSLRIRPPGFPERLRFVNLGTTGTCNASCVHCPTGKAETAHSPRGTMPMAIFQAIIDGIAEHDLPVTDQIAFGLFGDALVDPLVVQRAEYLRQHLPNVRLSINTNGASFNAAKHAALFGLADTIALHCESLEPTTYNYLMHPLRLERVQPKFEQILEIFPGKVNVSVPISRRNRDEAPAIRAWFMERGAANVTFDALSSRCSDDLTLFNSLALAPEPIRCPPVIMDDLIVDCDGYVLVCCQDFKRVEGIGSFADSSFAEVISGAQRQAMRKLLAENRHEALATCSKCFGDIRGRFVPA
ncbi:radical SAM/SPASM domain-containing protein [Acidisphaera sp. L21]|uniref:radical SAM/SPASM domain-containing protein n=1 Tax=Acidisphaera sp. L21 TaxID=1641851 RepID=UPI00131B394B|nr:SPASM domain-containing protein [Acidisphaera sp. L21]